MAGKGGTEKRFMSGYFVSPVGCSRFFVIPSPGTHRKGDFLPAFAGLLALMRLPEFIDPPEYSKR